MSLVLTRQSVTKSITTLLHVGIFIDVPVTQTTLCILFISTLTYILATKATMNQSHVDKKLVSAVFYSQYMSTDNN